MLSISLVDYLFSLNKLASLNVIRSLENLFTRHKNSNVYHARLILLSYSINIFLFKHDLDRCKTHPKFDPTTVRTCHLQIIIVYFMSLRLLL